MLDTADLTLPTALLPATRDLPAIRDVPGPTTGALSRLAQDLGRRTALWRPRVAFHEQERYAVRLARSADYEAWLLTWLPGQSTGLHDHGGSAGAFLVLEGVLDEIVLGRDHRGGTATVRRSLAARRVRSFGGSYLHDVGNSGDQPAVSLHVYAPALETMQRFSLEDSGRLQVVAQERAGTDW